MNQPQRFKAAQAFDCKGQLMSIGSRERPDPEALRRVAQRLGISAAALTSAAAIAVVRAASAEASGAAGALSSGQPREPIVSRATGAAAPARFDNSGLPELLSSHKPASADSLTSPGSGSASAGALGTRAAPADPRLAHEVASLDRVRAFANRGDAAGALRELNGFGQSYGYATLHKEAMLVNIDVLLSLGRKVEAAALARQLLALGAPATQRAKLESLVSNQQ